MLPELPHRRRHSKKIVVIFERRERQIAAKRVSARNSGAIPKLFIQTNDRYFISSKLLDHRRAKCDKNRPERLPVNQARGQVCVRSPQSDGASKVFFKSESSGLPEINSPAVGCFIFFSGRLRRSGPASVPIVHAQDRRLDCKAIAIEVEANNQKVGERASEEGLKVARNVAAGVAGIVVPVLWFAMDWQGVAGKEVAALQSRQQYLAAMAEERCRSPDDENPAKKKK